MPLTQTTPSVMPSLPRSPFGRRSSRRAPEAAPAHDEPRVEIIESPGLRWINIERPRQVDLAWLRGALRVPPARLRGRHLAQPAPEGRRVRRLPVHRAALPALRQAGRPPQRRRARPVRRPRLPDHAPERAAAADRVPVRALPHQRGAARVRCSPRARATCSTRSSTSASTPRSRCCARSATSSSGSRRRSSRATTRPRSCATSPTSSRRSSTSARSSARSGRPSPTSSATRRATCRTTSTSTSTTSTTRPSASGTCSRTTRRSWRRSSPPTRRRSRTGPTRRSGC